MYAGKVLVVFYSRTGTTRRAASALAEMLDADVEEIVVTRDRAGPFGYLRSLVEAINQKPAEIVAAKRDPSAYDLVVIGSPVWAGCVSSPVRAYLVANQRRLPRVAFFCSFAQRGADSALTQMRTLARKSPLAECRVTPRETLHGDASRDSGGICRTGSAQAGGSGRNACGALKHARTHGTVRPRVTVWRTLRRRRKRQLARWTGLKTPVCVRLRPRDSRRYRRA